MSKELWIYAEHTNGIVATSYFEMLSKVVSIYRDKDDVPKFVALVLSDNDAVVETLKASGADKVKLSNLVDTFYSRNLYLGSSLKRVVV